MTRKAMTAMVLVPGLLGLSACANDDQNAAIRSQLDETRRLAQQALDLSRSNEQRLGSLENSVRGAADAAQRAADQAAAAAAAAREAADKADKVYQRGLRK